MIVLAIFTTACAAVWTLFVLFANGMASAPSKELEGKSTIVLAWAVTAVLWAAWAWG